MRIKQNILPKVVVFAVLGLASIVGLANIARMANAADLKDSDIIQIEDEELLRAVNVQLSARIRGRKELDPVTYGQAKGLTILSYDNTNQDKAKIKSIAGIKYFENLTRLNLIGGEISDISELASLKKLEVLNINMNQIEDFSVLEGMTALKRIQIGDNKITDYSPIIAMKNLESFGNNGNTLIDLSPFANLTLTGRIFIRNQKGETSTKERIFMNPIRDNNNVAVPIIETADVINVDKDGSPDENGGYLKLINAKDGETGTVTVEWDKSDVKFASREALVQFSGVLTINFELPDAEVAEVEEIPTPVIPANPPQIKAPNTGFRRR